MVGLIWTVMTSNSAGDNLPAIDFRRIAFPSDGLTVGVLRRLFPKQFDSEPDTSFFSGSPFRSAHGLEHAEDAVGGMLYMERQLALSAFSLTVGDPHPKRSLAPEDRDDYAAELGQLYVRYGIAPGNAAAQQLIRSIESQAIAQAAGHGGPPSVSVR
jgi:hypothetical protein